MGVQAKITSKGQITIPLRVRTALGVKAGDNLIFDMDGEDVFVRPVRRTSVFAKYRGIGNPGIDAGREEIIKEIRKMRGYEPDEK